MANATAILVSDVGADDKVHLLLGASMALFGLLRIVQICFFDRDTLASPGAFTHLSKTPPGDATYPVAEREESVVEAVVQHLQNFVRTSSHLYGQNPDPRPGTTGREDELKRIDARGCWGCVHVFHTAVGAQGGSVSSLLHLLL
jgi:hypothetical protein